MAVNAGLRNRRGIKPSVQIDTLTIVRKELERDGLTKYEILPADLYRGENSLLKRCIYPSWAGEEIKQFYDIATNRFEQLILGLFRMQDNIFLPD